MFLICSLAYGFGENKSMVITKDYGTVLKTYVNFYRKMEINCFSLFFSKNLVTVFFAFTINLIFSSVLEISGA